MRNYEGDYDISHNEALISNIYYHKNRIKEEDRIYPYIDIEKDLDTKLFERVRFYADRRVNYRHPWMDMSDLDLLKSAKLYKKDKITGMEGITLAGLMLFGTDDAIKSEIPYCYTDALLREDDEERYDDRDFIETNLIDTYYRLLNFIGKYTKNRFALSDDGTRSISPMGIIAEEIVANMLMHRTLNNGRMSRIMIYKDKLIAENPNSFGTMRHITEKDYLQLSKNPSLAAFFREIGFADELGSGVRKITKNSLKYSGKEPIFEDSEMFRVIIPLTREGVIVHEDGEIIHLDEKSSNVSLTKNEQFILSELKKNPRVTQNELVEILSLSRRTIQYSLTSLKKNNVITRVDGDRGGYWQIN